jgi:rhodanese-related sulfurtransferase
VTAETPETSSTDVSPARLQELLEGGEAQLIDVREDYEHEAGHIPGDRHVDVTQLQGQADTIDKARPVVFYCRAGDRSNMPADLFRASGYDAYSLAGGLAAWVETGFPLEPEDGSVASRRPGPQN